MSRRITAESKLGSLVLYSLATGAVLLAIGAAAFAPLSAQEGRGAQKKAAKKADPLPPLFLKEEWKQPPYTGDLNDAKRRVTQEALTNPNLELKIYGACKDSGVEVYGTPGDSIFPMNLWTGMCGAPVAVTLRDKTSFVDLSGQARIRWVTRAANLHAIRPVLKLADGTLIVGNHADVTPTEFYQTEPNMLETEIAIGAVRWFRLDAEKVATTRPADNPDLTKVDEVGFADLMAGGGHGSAGWVNLGRIEVFGKPVAR
jgi:hypothetical protein